jgi:predicted flap endonuclease-1-like 5' DNA nuclease
VDLRKQLDAVRTRIRELETEKTRLQKQLLERDAEIARLKSAASNDADTLKRLTERDAQVARLQSKASTLQQQVEERDARIAELETDGWAEADLSQQLTDRDRQLREQEAQLAAARTTILKLEEELSEARSGPGSVADDDLKVLRGIGPSFERALHAAGIRNFAQIAAWTADDIAGIAGKLKTTAQRIKRDDWVGCAKEELRRKGSGK